jgi:fructuronate reductase
MRSPGEAEALSRAGHQYQLVVVGNGTESRHTMTAIDEALFIQDSKARFLERISTAEVSTVTLTVTEKGYCAKADGTLDTQHSGLKGSVLDYLVEGLRARQAGCGRPLAVMSCDNLSANGRMLEGLCLAWASESGKPFDSKLVSFPNSMVDRIVPAGPDPLTVKTEAFHQWVIEDRFIEKRPDWEQDGLVFTPDVEPFERMKLCLLNASHSFLAYYGQLQGHEYVHQAITDDKIRGLVKELCLQEVGPHLSIPSPWTLEGYVDEMLTRFDNPGLPHKLSQIAMDGSQKVPHRFLPFWEHSSVVRLALSAWFTYYWTGFTQQGSYLILDPQKEELSKRASADFQQTAKSWKALLDWPDHPVENLQV